MRGVCLDACNPAGAPTIRQLQALGGDGHRLVVMNDDRFFGYSTTLHANRYNTAAVLTGESFASDQYAVEAARYGERTYPRVWIIGNEWNIRGDASWPYRGDANDDDAFCELWNAVAPVLRSAQPLASLYVGGMFSEPHILDHFDRVAGRLSPYPDGIDFHPYVNTTDEIEIILTEARQTFAVETAVFEWNWNNVAEIDGFQQLLNGLTSHSCWFCWGDGQVDGLGLYTKRRRRKTLFRAYQQALRR